MKQRSERLLFLDIARGIGIMLVVLGHLWSAPEELRKYIYSFHMPLFFVISGYLYNDNKYQFYRFREYLEVKLNQLIIPYFTLALVNYILFFINTKYDFKVMLKKLFGILYSIGNVEWTPQCSPIWFLTALFCVEIAFFILLKFSRNFLPIWIFVMSLIGYSLYLWFKFPENFILPNKLPWNMDTACTGIVFYYLGFELRKHNKLLEFLLKNKIVLFLIIPMSLLSAYTMVVLHGRTLGLGANFLNNYFLLYLGACSGTLLVFRLSKFLEFSQNIANIIMFYGKNTIPIFGYNYLVHQQVKLFLVKLDSNLWWLNFLIQLLVYVGIIWFIKHFKELHYRGSISLLGTKQPGI